MWLFIWLLLLCTLKLNDKGLDVFSQSVWTVIINISLVCNFLYTEGIVFMLVMDMSNVDHLVTPSLVIPDYPCRGHGVLQTYLVELTVSEFG